jgi:signal transduction histidine kinase
MRPLPRVAWMYIGAVALAAAALLVTYLPLADLFQLESVALAVLSILAILVTGTHGIPIRERIRVTLTTVIIFADILLMPVGLAAWTTAFGMTWSFIHLRRRWYNVLFNASAYVLTVFSTGLIYRSLDDGPPILFGSWANALAVCVAGTFYYLANTALVSLMVDLREGHRPGSSWIPAMRGAGTEYFTLLLLGVLAALLYGVNRVLIVLIIVPAVIVYDSYRTSQDLRRERDKLIDTEESVRKDLQMELHDGLAQTMAAMTMRAAIAAKLVAIDTEKATTEIKELEAQLREATRGVRTLLYELRPLVLESQGLVAALETYIAKLQKPGAPHISLEVHNFTGRLDHRAEISVFGIVQEAVNNILKHAQATTVVITISGSPERLHMTIKDNGKGFDPKQVQEKYAQRGSFGLLNMQERAARIGGELQITSQAGQGATVTLTVNRPT